MIDCEEDSPEEETLELVSILVEDYESKHYAIEVPDPNEAIKIKMEGEGFKKKDLAKYFGSASRVSEVLNKKRPLTLEMMRKNTSRNGDFCENFVGYLIKFTHKKLDAHKSTTFLFLSLGEINHL